MADTIICSIYSSPCGQLTLGALGDELCLCDWNVGNRRATIDRRLCRRLDATMAYGRCNLIDRTSQQLDEYFAGKRQIFDLPLLICGTTLQRDVWRTLTLIPWGETCSYSEIADKIGHTKAVRAVASAIGANSMSIIIPCHRVVGKNGSLTGYAGGLEAKNHLLALEARLPL